MRQSFVFSGDQARLQAVIADGAFHSGGSKPPPYNEDFFTYHHSGGSKPRPTKEFLYWMCMVVACDRLCGKKATEATTNCNNGFAGCMAVSCCAGYQNPSKQRQDRNAIP